MTTPKKHKLKLKTMETITDKKWLCILKRDVVFLTSNGARVDGMLAFASDKLSHIRAAVRGLGWLDTHMEGVYDGCVFRRGSRLAAYVVSCNMSGDIVLLRARRYSDLWHNFPASFCVDSDQDSALNDMLEQAKEQAADGWLIVHDIV